MSAVCVAPVVLLLGILTLIPSEHGFIFVKCAYFPRKCLVQPEFMMALAVSVNMSTAYAYLYLSEFNARVL